MDTIHGTIQLLGSDGDVLRMVVMGMNDRVD
jgi:hypothetical protein